MLENPVLVWFLVGLALAILEFMVPGVVLIFFAGGAWIVAATTHFELTNDLTSQVGIFAGSSLALLLSLRSWIHGRLYGHVSHLQDLDKNYEDLIGKQVTLLKDVTPGRTPGAAELKGAPWTVISETAFTKGSIATISGIEGIALKISRVTEVSDE